MLCEFGVKVIDTKETEYEFRVKIQEQKQDTENSSVNLA
jgi:hypothetical protein